MRFDDSCQRNATPGFVETPSAMNVGHVREAFAFPWGTLVLRTLHQHG
jgi:hypothetical protein